MRPLNISHTNICLFFSMAATTVHRGCQPTILKHNDIRQSFPLHDVHSRRSRPKYRGYSPDFALRPISPEPSVYARAHTTADTSGCAVRSANTRDPHPSGDSCYPPRPTGFPAPPSLSMKHDPVLFVVNRSMSPCSEDGGLGSREYQRRILPGSLPHTREPPVEVPLSPSPVNRDSSTPPGVASILSDLPPVFDIGLPPRQDHRSSVRHSKLPSRQSATPPVHCENDSKAFVNTRRISTESPSPSESESNWTDYAFEIGKGPEGPGMLYQCTYPVRQPDGSNAPCHYNGRKQLVKRHVEGRHLQIKLFGCGICDKTFAQKIAMQVHQATHTGDKPWACEKGCDLAFSDPARRHKHYVEVHKHEPRQIKRKQRPAARIISP
ncbi:Zinc finger protein GLIS2 [Mycena sanguinolenta]|uniref:Zinc finger protein GLIS2 n=1 Tax=Mycena sanguinolenta TaxID=230812 RepID=A0A8H6YAS5_9AGAR|nr:Zinc finger protein GLIS2 [Mycena sanguinolenta]